MQQKPEWLRKLAAEANVPAEWTACEDDLPAELKAIYHGNWRQTLAEEAARTGRDATAALTRGATQVYRVSPSEFLSQYALSR